MASGPWHYSKAEEILDTAEHADADADHGDIALLLKFANVHATLALAAATAIHDADGGVPPADWNAWQAAASETTQTGDTPDET